MLALYTKIVPSVWEVWETEPLVRLLPGARGQDIVITEFKFSGISLQIGRNFFSQKRFLPKTHCQETTAVIFSALMFSMCRYF